MHTQSATGRPVARPDPGAGGGMLLPAPKRSFWQMARKQWQLLVMVVPFLLFVFVNSYIPLWGWSYAFFEASPQWFPDFTRFAGLDMFIRAYSNPSFWQALRNTVGISVMKLTTGFVGAIGLAVMLNEVKVKWFKKTVQTVSYLPHFVSWVVCASLINIALSPENGIVNRLLVAFGVLKEPLNWFMQDNALFWVMATVTELWKEIGWSAIIYLAAMSGIDPDLYEAAAIDGAGRFRKILHVTLPGISTTVKLLLVLSIGGLISAGFEQIILLQRPITIGFSEVLDTYIFKMVWFYPRSVRYNVPMGTAVGIVNSLVSFLLVYTANFLAKKIDGSGVI